jgi:hypothetical protein
MKVFYTLFAIAMLAIGLHGEGLLHFGRASLVLQDDYAGPAANIAPPLKHAPGCSDFFLSKWKPVVTRTDCALPWMKISCGEGYAWLITFEEQ